VCSTIFSIRLSDPNTILFIGFSSTRHARRHHQEGARSVKIFNQDVAIRAHIGHLEQFSDHADTPELLEWFAYLQESAAGHLPRPWRNPPPHRNYACHDVTLGWKVEAAQWMQKVEVK